MKDSALPTHRNPWILAVVGFMAIVMGVNAIMITLAVRSSRGVIEPHPYEQGMNFQEILNQRQQFKELEWTLRSELRKDATNLARLTLSITHQNAEPVTGQRLRAEIVRPSDESLDRNCALSEESAGGYTCSLTGLSDGLYLIKLWTHENARLDIELILR